MAANFEANAMGGLAKAADGASRWRLMVVLALQARKIKASDTEILGICKQLDRLADVAEMAQLPHQGLIKLASEANALPSSTTQAAPDRGEVERGFADALVACSGG